MLLYLAAVDERKKNLCWVAGGGGGEEDKGRAVVK